jgi:hypothetical protein
MKLKFNVGIIDRIARVIIGIALIIIGLSFNYWILAIGILIALTGVFSFCWLYALFGISTKKKTAKT